ncbi:hypothetical protein B0A49_01324 [Cryomyces minteri]|uniref:Uncharacterized protein n=1 Tax=Cryomyces minteri TaxID=331657 RepID=A0A4U0XNZ6_9PEZI|nr:hypothetical protein B0A49_01324 [Cryomyces minteri]
MGLPIWRVPTDDTAKDTLKQDPTAASRSSIRRMASVRRRDHPLRVPRGSHGQRPERDAIIARPPPPAPEPVASLAEQDRFNVVLRRAAEDYFTEAGHRFVFDVDIIGRSEPLPDDLESRNSVTTPSALPFTDDFAPAGGHAYAAQRSGRTIRDRFRGSSSSDRPSSRDGIRRPTSNTGSSHLDAGDVAERPLPGAAARRGRNWPSLRNIRNGRAMERQSPTHPLRETWRVDQTNSPDPITNGLGDRQRSPSSLSSPGHDVWETMLTTITPDASFPTADSSFTSAVAAASFSNSNQESNDNSNSSGSSPSTHITVPDEAEPAYDDFIACDSDTSSDSDSGSDSGSDTEEHGATHSGRTAGDVDVQQLPARDPDQHSANVHQRSSAAARYVRNYTERAARQAEQRWVEGDPATSLGVEPVRRYSSFGLSRTNHGDRADEPSLSAIAADSAPAAPLDATRAMQLLHARRARRREDQRRGHEQQAARTEAHIAALHRQNSRRRAQSERLTAEDHHTRPSRPAGPSGAEAARAAAHALPSTPGSPALGGNGNDAATAVRFRYPDAVQRPLHDSDADRSTASLNHRLLRRASRGSAATGTSSDDSAGEDVQGSRVSL